jgi:hypothetical protein
MRKLLYVLLLVALIGCVPVDTPATLDVTTLPPLTTPTQEVLPGPLGDGFTVVNANPLLEGAHYTEGRQDYPHGYTLYNDLHNILGGQDRYTVAAPIDAIEDGYALNAVAIAGTWGFTTDMIVVAPSCLIIRFDGWASVVEIASYTRNLKAVAFIRINGDLFELAEHDLPQAPGAPFEFIWPMRAAGAVQVTVAIRAHYATAAPGTEIVLGAIYVAVDEDGDHCR